MVAQECSRRRGCENCVRSDDDSRSRCVWNVNKAKCVGPEDQNGTDKVVRYMAFCPDPFTLKAPYFLRQSIQDGRQTQYCGTYSFCQACSEDEACAWCHVGRVHLPDPFDFGSHVEEYKLSEAEEEILQEANENAHNLVPKLPDKSRCVPVPRSDEVEMSYACDTLAVMPSQCDVLEANPSFLGTMITKSPVAFSFGIVALVVCFAGIMWRVRRSWRKRRKRQHQRYE